MTGQRWDEPAANELIAATLGEARQRGYLLIGPRERVYRRDHSGGCCESVSVQDDCWVHELLTRGVLTRGEPTTVGSEPGTEKAVTVIVAHHQ